MNAFIVTIVVVYRDIYIHSVLCVLILSCRNSTIPTDSISILDKIRIVSRSYSRSVAKRNELSVLDERLDEPTIVRIPDLKKDIYRRVTSKGIEKKGGKKKKKVKRSRDSAHLTFVDLHVF